MEYSHNTAEMQPNPNPNFSYNLNSNTYQQTTFDPRNALYHNNPRPSGVDPSHVPLPLNVPYTQHPASSEPQQGAASAAAAAYYQDPNAAYYYQDPNAALYYQAPNASWPAAITQLGASSYALGVATTNPAVQTPKKNTWKKGPKAKKTKIVQSAWCEVCKLGCNSKDVLDLHKLGKKHKKNLESLKAKFTVVPAPVIPAAVPPAPKPAIGPIIGPKENPEKPALSNSQKARKKAANARTEDLDAKRRRVVEGGAAAEGVRACKICNVVCNSDTVFRFHLAGQKHASMFKKYVSGVSFAPGV